MSSGGSSYRAPVEAPNTLQSMQQVTIVEAVSEGPIVGLYTGDEKSIALNKTNLKTAEGAFTYQNVGWDMRLGLPDQEPFNIDGTEAEVSVGVEVTHNFPRASGSGSGAISRTISNLNCTHVRVTLSVQGLYEQLIDEDHSGDTVGQSVNYTVTIKDKNGTVQIADVQSRSDKTVSSSQWAKKYALGGTGPWTVTVAKNHADSTLSRIKNDLYWSSYTEIVGRRMIYPHTAMMLIRGNAETFGSSIPSRVYRIKGKLISVPQNYDPATRAYSGIWNGTFKTAWTDNPAWVLYDLINDDRCGLKRYFPTSWTNGLIDKWTLYEISKICDATVTDGYGGAEPRYTVNVQMMGTGEAKEVIQSIASVFHGMTYWGSALLYTVSDYPSDPIRSLNQTTIINGSLSYSTGSQQERHSVAMVTWYDPDNYGQANIECVIDWDAYMRFGKREVQVTAYGCYSRGQAHRHGLWTLLTEDEQWQATCEMGLDGYDLMPGSVVRVADPTIMGVRYSGRVIGFSSDVNGYYIQLDAPVTLAAGETYYIYVVADDGTDERFTVVSRGTSDTLEVAAAPTKTYSDYAAWCISGTNAAPRVFCVRSLKETEEGRVQLSLREVNTGKYTQLENNIVLATPPLRVKTKGSVTAPAGLAVLANTYIENGTPTQRLTFSWSSTGDPDVAMYEAGYRSPAGAWMNFQPQRVFSLDVPAAMGGDWLFRVRSCALDGRLSDWVEKSYTLNGIAILPKAPTNLTAIGSHRSIMLNWSAANDALVGYYEVLMSETNSIDDAVMTGKIYGSTFTVMGLGVLDTRWFWVQSVSYANDGVKSAAIGPVSGTTKALEMEDIPDQSIPESKFLPHLQGLKDEIKALAEASVLHGINAYEDRDTAAIATQELDTKVVEGLEAEASARTQLAATVGENSAAIVAEQTARATADQAEATARTQLAAKVGENTSAIQTAANAVATVDGKVEATYSVVVDTNGRIAGFKLGSDGETSEMAFLANAFYFANPVDGGDPIPLFTIDATGETPKLVMNGNLFVNAAKGADGGWIVGNMISAAAQIQIGAGGSLIMGNGSIFQMGSGAVLIDSEAAVLQLKDPNNLETGDYLRASTGQLVTYKYLNGAYRPMKALNRVTWGQNVANNSTVQLDGYWPSTPKIIVSPCTLQSFHGGYPNQHQTLNVNATNILWNVTTGIASFIPVAQLIIAAGATQNVDSSVKSSNNFATLTAYGASQTIPANTSSINISVDAYAAKYQSEYVGEIINRWFTECIQTSCTIYLNVDGTDYYIGSYSFPKVLYTRYQFEQYWLDASTMELGTAALSRYVRLSNTINVPTGYAHTVYVKGVFSFDSNNKEMAYKSFDSSAADACSGCWMRMANMVINLSGATLLATGTLNYMAVAE